MSKRNSTILLILIMSVALILSGCNSNEQPSDNGETINSEANKSNFPEKPIKFIVPWSPGGSSDAMSRALSEVAKDHLGQPLVVVNRDGAGGTIATTEFTEAKPDGYTVLMDAVGVFTTQPFMRDVKYSIDDFKGVIGLSYEPIFLAVNSDNPWESIEDLVENFKKSGKAVKYGHSGNGGLPHLSQAALYSQAGIKSESVPFDSNSTALTNLLGKHVDVAVGHPTEMLPHLQEGKIRLLGVFLSERDERSEFNDIPTFKEQGYDIDMSVWKFILVPKDTPQEVIDKLYEGFHNMIEDPKYVKFCETAKLAMNPIEGEEIIERLKEEREFTYNVLKDLGLINK